MNPHSYFEGDRYYLGHQGLTPREIIEFVAKWFTTHPRSFNSNGGCVYNGPNGKHCAIGLFVKPCHRAKLIEGPGAYELLTNSLLKFQLLSEPVSHIRDTRFWALAQRLHDGNLNWEKSPQGATLTAHGKLELETILIKFG